MNRTILLASFIFPERLDWFFKYLDDKFSIPKEKVFVYKNLDDESKLIVTFRFVLKENKRINFKRLFPNSILIHKKGDALYTINALNRLIELKSGDQIGNINYKSYTIDWSEYQNNLLLTNKDTLNISKIKRIF